jgi:two-component system, cell cycle response regulator
MTAPLRILVADDVPVQRRVLAKQLSTAGYVVDTAGDGEEALAKVLAGSFDVLITDRDMPGMDGATLCRRVREADLPGGYIFIVMLTGQVSVTDYVSGLESGADVYVRKPAHPEELLASLNAGCRILRLERELRAARATDGLLNVYRRDYLDDQLPRDVERARRYKTPLAVVMMDLDRFKRINDEHGHAVGDQILKAFCERVRACMRQSDWVARYGGEEFALVLPQTSLEGAQAAAEKVREVCAGEPMKSSVGPINVTVSLGVATLKAEDDSERASADILRRADAALYGSKRDGRNRVTVDAA